MKTKFFFLSVLLLGALAVQAQGKNSLRVGVNAAFWDLCDMTGAVVYAEYERELTSFMAIVPRISIGSANKQNQWVNAQLSSQTLSASLRFTPFPWEIVNRLELDAGFLYQHNVQTNLYHSDVQNNYWNDHLFGMLFALNINLLQTDRHVLGIRGEMLTDMGHDYYFNADGPHVGVYYGVQF